MDPRQPGRSVAIVWSSLLLLLLFALASVRGQHAAANGERVLGELEPAVAWVRFLGDFVTTWTLHHAGQVPTWMAYGSGTFAVLALLFGRLRALPVVMVAAAVWLVTAAQILLLADGTGAVPLYLGALGCLVMAGFWCPLPRLTVPAQPTTRWYVDGILVVLIGSLGLLTRLYALTELPGIFIGEMSVAMLSSRTFSGILDFIPGALLGTSIGLVHMPPQWLFYQVFGTSFYALRLTAVAMSMLGIVLMYWFLRSLSGRTAAILGSLILIAAPEQLWWGRDENTNYAAVCCLGIGVAALGWWLRRNLTSRAALATALLLPFERFFYLAAVTLVAYPWMLLAHAMVFTRGAWRRALPVAAILALGTLLWIFSLSIMNKAVVGGPWRFLNPAHHGEMVTSRSAEGRSAGIFAIAQMQVASLSDNLIKVSKSLAYRGGYSQWYQRVDPLRHATWMNVALAAVVALSIAYLLGQLFRAQAAVLLAWLILGLAPAILSSAPDDRRMAVAFPAMYACSGVAVAGLLQIIRQRCGRVVGWLSAALAAVGIAAILLSSIASHFNLQTGELEVSRLQRATTDIFQKSDAIYYDFDPPSMMLLVLGNGDSFLQRPPCIQFVTPRAWLDMAFRQPCTFQDAPFRLTMPEERLTRLAASYQPPQRVTFMLSSWFNSQAPLAMLQSLFPDADAHPVLGSEDAMRLNTVTVDRAMLDELRTPWLRSAPETPLPAQFASQFLRGFSLHHEPTPQLEGVRIEGGILVSNEDWYAIDLTPACAAAKLSVDGESVVAAQPPRPLLSGVHAFDIELASADTCPLPLQLDIKATRSGEVNGAEPMIVAPRPARLPLVKAPPADLFNGYTDVGPVAGLRGVGQVLRALPDGRLLLLSRDGDEFIMQRLDAEGQLAGSWKVPLPQGVILWGMAAGQDEQSLILTDAGGWLFDAEGKLLSRWPKLPFQTADVVFLKDGRIVAAVPEHAALDVYRPDGNLDREFAKFAGGPGKFSEPVTVTMNERGDLVVGQTNGDMLVFRTPLDRFQPQFVSAFHMDFSMPSVLPRSLTFDRPERVVAGDPERQRVLVHGLDGRRLLAREPEHDWAKITKQIGEVRYLASTPKYLYVLAGEPFPRRFTR